MKQTQIEIREANKILLQNIKNGTEINIVRAFCQEFGLTHKELGDILGYSESTIKSAARGITSEPIKIGINALRAAFTIVKPMRADLEQNLLDQITLHKKQEQNLRDQIKTLYEMINQLQAEAKNDLLIAKMNYDEEDSINSYQWYRVFKGEILEWTDSKRSPLWMKRFPYNTQDWFPAYGTKELNTKGDKNE